MGGASGAGGRRSGLIRGPGLGRGRRERLVLVEGEPVKVYTLIALVEACKITRSTLLFRWLPGGVLPPPTQVDDARVRWYSENFIRTIAGAVNRHRGLRGKIPSLDMLREELWKVWREEKKGAVL